MPGLSTNYNLVSVVDNMEGFEILLSDDSNDKKGIRIIFKNSVESYRCSDETYRLKTFEDLSDQHGTKFYAEWSFFRVLNSRYLHWLSEQSCGISDSRPLMHFSFFTTNSILDIITSYEPKVEFVESK